MTRKEAIAELSNVLPQTPALRLAIDSLKTDSTIKEAYDRGYKDGQDALAFHLELCKEEAEPRNTCDKGSADMLRRTNYGLWVDDDGKSNKNELAIDYIVESARSVGIEVIDGKTALDIQFMAEVMKRLREKQEPCEDAISRQAVLEAFNLSEKTRKYGGDHSGYDTMMLYEIQDVIEDLPSIQPKPKTDVFDKIIAEIEQEYNRLRTTRTDEILELGECLGLKLSLKIIDKYRADIGGK